MNPGPKDPRGPLGRARWPGCLFGRARAARPVWPDPFVKNVREAAEIICAIDADPPAIWLAGQRLAGWWAGRPDAGLPAASSRILQKASWRGCLSDGRLSIRLAPGRQPAGQPASYLLACQSVAQLAGWPPADRPAGCRPTGKQPAIPSYLRHDLILLYHSAPGNSDTIRYDTIFSDKIHGNQLRYDTIRYSISGPRPDTIRYGKSFWGETPIRYDTGNRFGERLRYDTIRECSRRVLCDPIRYDTKRSDTR